MGAYRLFLQGRCRFGDSGWNVHARSRWGRPYAAGPGGGGGAGGWGAAGRRSAHLIRSPVFQHTGGGGSWAAPSQRSANLIRPPVFQHTGGGWGAPSQGSTSVIQPPVFQQAGGGQGGWGAPSQGSTNVTQPPVFQPSTWGGSRDGGGLFTASSSASPGNKSAVLTQNGFSALTSASRGDGCRDGQQRLFERIAEDMAVWESSGQWLFSCYSPVQDKPNVSGFLEFSPDEMRLEYYKCRANNDTGNYINSVHQLAQQWRNRVQELKALNASGNASVLSQTTNATTQPFPPSGFGGQQASSFGLPSFPVNSSGSVSSFSFHANPSLPSGNAPAFGSSAAASHPPTFGVTSSSSVPHPAGFGSPSAPSAASFPLNTSGTTSSFGTSALSGSGSSAAANSSSTAPLTVSGTPNAATGASPSGSSSASVAQSASASGQNVTSAPSAVPNGFASGELFTPKSKLSAEELKQFEAKKFTLGKIPLKPPPADLVYV